MDENPSTMAEKATLALIVHPAYQHQLVTPPESASLMDALPWDVLQLIAAFLSPAQDLVRFGATSKRMWLAIHDDAHWKRLCLEKFHVPKDITPPSWMQLFKFNHEFLYKVLLSQQANSFASSLPGARMPQFPIYVHA